MREVKHLYCANSQLVRLTPKPAPGMKIPKREYRCQYCGNIWSVTELRVKGEEQAIVKLNGIAREVLIGTAARRKKFKFK